MLHPFNKIEKTAEEIYEFDLLKAESAGTIGVGNKPYLSRHSDKGVLLIHGFAAAPDELLPLAYELEKYDISDSNFIILSISKSAYNSLKNISLILSYFGAK